MCNFPRAMEAAVDHLQHELAGVRTGRANPGLLENIPVEAYGDKLPLKACGTVTVRSSQLLAVSVFDSGVSWVLIWRGNVLGCLEGKRPRLFGKWQPYAAAQLESNRGCP